MSADQSGAGIVLPGRNEELKKKEAEIIEGAPLTVNLSMPDGSVDTLEITVSKEVGYVKALLSQKLGVAYQKLNLKFDGRNMIDPMSFIDHKGVKPPSIDVKVEVLE
uniref:Ubiquitin-like domain-containing protein n=1 Tax=Chromera velia CCMP2878 TaxID=1169474 RepID=A0A0G4IAN6_9ALVE|eukprot:Cvel_12635.t1-p1 / transcript=Cvel_12635.t1 / gene=Cvel_12635 / organism=Chromera_velia_CCMP2878 / gene_product=hypothetical protein / transcript_product=hypothetical protein / location=Cvel_scaffold834:33280-35803(+) / protein_length=106 / sequence_SO=supercontig / SO=protein_coding / is_pseudo=false